MKKVLCPLVCSLLLSGCLASRFPISQNTVSVEPTYSDTKVFLLWGLVPQPKYTDPVQVCGGVDNVSMVETKTSFWDGLISLLTFGLFVPQTANVYCTTYGYQTHYQQVVPSYASQGYQPYQSYQQQYPQYQQSQSPYASPYGGQAYSRRY